MSVLAQNGSAARMVVIEPKQGMQKQFEEGYRRHLDWHKRNGDPWTWYGWNVVSGDRFGLFVDGTFGRTYADFDAAVAPAADAADNAENVSPYADFRSISTIELLPDVSTAQLLERGTPSPFVETVTFRLVAGRQHEFERAIREIHRAQERAADRRPYTWYRVVSGGRLPTYVLMLPFERLSELGSLRNPFAATYAPSESAVSEALERMVSATEDVYSETLRLRADMSYAPEKPRARP